jgi:hypothetical protein
VIVNVTLYVAPPDETLIPRKTNVPVVHVPVTRMNPYNGVENAPLDGIDVFGLKLPHGSRMMPPLTVNVNDALEQPGGGMLSPQVADGVHE